MSLHNRSSFIFLTNFGALFCTHCIFSFHHDAAIKSNSHQTVKIIILLFLILLKFFCTRISCVGVHLAISIIFIGFSTILELSILFRLKSEKPSCELITLNHFLVYIFLHSSAISGFDQYKYNLNLWLPYLFFISSKKYGMKSVQFRFSSFLVFKFQNLFAAIL